MNDKLSTWLTKELTKRGWSARELGRRSGFTGAYISRIIAGEQKGSYDFCAAIAPSLEKTPEEVFRIVGLLPTEPKQGKPISGHSATYNLPPIPPVPNDKHIIELFEHLDTLRKRQVYDFARWMLKEQENPLNSSQLDETKQEEGSTAVKYVELLLAVNEADPEVIEQVINRLQKILHEQKEKLPQQAEADPI